MNIRIRDASSQDGEEIRNVHLQAFPENEGRQIAALADRLLREDSEPATVALVAEIGGEVVGHVAFSPVYAAGEKACLGYILAPLAVKPGFQNAGIGSELVEGGITRLSNMGIDLFLVYGDPRYYGKFGFKSEPALKFLPPYELKFPFGWLAILRSQGAAGEQAVQLSCVESLRNSELW